MIEGQNIEELKPCPFCGCSLVAQGSAYMHPNDKCIMTGTIFRRESSYFAKWQARPESGLVKELVEALTRAKETIEMLHQHGNFDNAVCDATNTICEGVVLTDRYVNAAIEQD